jgi:hypothetical protein
MIAWVSKRNQPDEIKKVFRSDVSNWGIDEATCSSVLSYFPGVVFTLAEVASSQFEFH